VRKREKWEGMASEMLNPNLSGGGSAKYGGRWNPKGSYVLYTAATPSLAMLEWLEHARARDMDEVYCLATLLIPEEPLQKFSPEQLPENWKHFPPPPNLQQYVADMIASGQWLGIEMPSVLLPIDYNIILNVHHPLFQQLVIEDVCELKPGKRLLPSPMG
jgi:RES domain-containing protein